MAAVDTTMRLQKFLSQAGVCSRRTAEEWMAAGRIKVNGAVCTELGAKVDPEKDRVEVDGKQIKLRESFIYILMNKPPGYITSMEDPEGRPVVTDLIPANMPRLWPVGRLDWNSEGLLLLTNDGALTHLLTHPEHHVTKRYAVKVQGTLEKDSPALEKLREGLDIGEGEVTQPAFIELVGHTDKNTWLEVTIVEGRNRQIRRMFEAVDSAVMKLRRLSIGPLTIDGLSSGSFRSLSSDEVLAVYEALEVAAPDQAQPSKRQLKRERDDEKQGRINKARRVANAPFRGGGRPRGQSEEERAANRGKGDGGAKAGGAKAGGAKAGGGKPGAGGKSGAGGRGAGSKPGARPGGKPGKKP
jgi:23S rRNA pseudouridine2605 synthase